MVAFSTSSVSVRVDPPLSFCNPSHEPFVVLTVTNEGGEREIKFPKKAWLAIAQHVAKGLSEAEIGMLTVALMEWKP